MENDLIRKDSPIAGYKIRSKQELIIPNNLEIIDYETFKTTDRFETGDNLVVNNKIVRIESGEIDYTGKNTYQIAYHGDVLDGISEKNSLSDSVNEVLDFSNGEATKTTSLDTFEIIRKFNFNGIIIPNEITNFLWIDRNHFTSNTTLEIGNLLNIDTEYLARITSIQTNNETDEKEYTLEYVTPKISKDSNAFIAVEQGDIFTNDSPATIQSWKNPELSISVYSLDTESYHNLSNIKYIDFEIQNDKIIFEYNYTAEINTNEIKWQGDLDQISINYQNLK